MSTHNSILNYMSAKVKYSFILTKKLFFLNTNLLTKHLCIRGTKLLLFIKSRLNNKFFVH